MHSSLSFLLSLWVDSVPSPCELADWRHRGTQRGSAHTRGQLVWLSAARPGGLCVAFHERCQTRSQGIWRPASDVIHHPSCRPLWIEDSRKASPCSRRRAEVDSARARTQGVAKPRATGMYTVGGTLRP